MHRTTAAIACMAAGGVSLVAGIGLMAGIPAGLVALGVVLVAVSVLLGWT